MAGKSFYEVLEAQIRQELREEIEAEVRTRLSRPNTPVHAFEQLETWLASHVGRTEFTSKTKASHHYFKNGSKNNSQTRTRAQTNAHSLKAKEQAPERLDFFHAQTVEEIMAVEVLRRHGAKIGECFTRNDLKIAWHKAALHTHPDRFESADAITQARMGVAFREITEAYSLLESLTRLPQAA